jgi:hypothetical protein
VQDPVTEHAGVPSHTSPPKGWKVQLLDVNKHVSDTLKCEMGMNGIALCSVTTADRAQFSLRQIFRCGIVTVGRMHVP